MRRTDGRTTRTPERDWRALREATGISLSEAARRADINKGVLSLIENRERRVTPEWAAALLRVYGWPDAA